MNLADTQAAIEANARKSHKAVQLYLQINEIAVRALLEAAANGNVICKTAARELAPLFAQLEAWKR